MTSFMKFAYPIYRDSSMTSIYSTQRAMWGCYAMCTQGYDCVHVFRASRPAPRPASWLRWRIVLCDWLYLSCEIFIPRVIPKPPLRIYLQVYSLFDAKFRKIQAQSLNTAKFLIKINIFQGSQFKSQFHSHQKCPPSASISMCNRFLMRNSENIKPKSWIQPNFSSK
jgi:hypothetical protein